MEADYEKKELQRCVDNGLRAWADGYVSVQEVRQLHGQIGELNRRAANEGSSDDNITDLRFMHQVSKSLIEKLKTSGRQTGVRQQYKSIKGNNSDV